MRVLVAPAPELSASVPKALLLMTPPPKPRKGALGVAVVVELPDKKPIPIPVFPIAVGLPRPIAGRSDWPTRGAA